VTSAVVVTLILLVSVADLREFGGVESVAGSNQSQNGSGELQA